MYSSVCRYTFLIQNYKRKLFINKSLQLMKKIEPGVLNTNRKFVLIKQAIDTKCLQLLKQKIIIIKGAKALKKEKNSYAGFLFRYKNILMPYF